MAVVRHSAVDESKSGAHVDTIAGVAHLTSVTKRTTEARRNQRHRAQL